MKIKSVILNILFIVILICLIYFFIYLNNSNFENFEVINPLIDITGTVETTQIDTITNPVSTPYNPPITETVFNGKTQNTPLSSSDFGFVLERVAKSKEGSTFIPDYKDGYYWINLNYVGTKYIYCIMDKNYWGGGWMLAMRSVFGSRTFSYDSDHFKKATTLNDSSAYTETILSPDWFNDPTASELSKSSIGDLIYTTSDSNKYDAKFDTFNYSKSVEWMAIFYVRNPQTGEKIIGGDLQAPKNTRGWVWREQNVKKNIAANEIGENDGISPLNLFIDLDKQSGENGMRDLTKAIGAFGKPYNQYGFAQNIWGKFTNMKSRSEISNNQIWSSQPNDLNADGSKNSYSFYGINYNNANASSGKALVRWGFAFDDRKDNTNDVYSGIGLSYKGQDSTNVNLANLNGYSAGNFEDMASTNDNSKYLDRPIHRDLRNKSYAVEWYVREKNYSI